MQKSKRDLADILLNRRAGDEGQSDTTQRPLEVCTQFNYGMKESWPFSVVEKTYLITHTMYGAR